MLLTLFLFYVIVQFLFFKDTVVSYMENVQIQKLVQYEELQLENHIDWSIAFHKDDISSDKEGFVEPAVKFIVGKKRKQL